MDRTKIYNEVSVDVGDGIMRTELDFLDNSLVGMVLTRDPLYYRVAVGDVNMPDNIAWKAYQEERLWWIVCLANDISNCGADIVVGDLLVIPDLLDVYDFYKKYRKR